MGGVGGVGGGVVCVVWVVEQQESSMGYDTRQGGLERSTPKENNR